MKRLLPKLNNILNKCLERPSPNKDGFFVGPILAPLKVIKEYQYLVIKSGKSKEVSSMSKGGAKPTHHGFDKLTMTSS
jgi:hypothetical protein